MAQNDQNQTDPSTDAQQPQPEADRPNASRRQFVRTAMKRAAYVAPIVVTLAASQSAMGASGSGSG